MNWELVGNIAFAVFVILGLVVILGEGIVAMLARDSVMEARTELRPLTADDGDLTAPVAPVAEVLHHHVPAYVLDSDLTGPMEPWEHPSPPTTYEGGHYVKPGTS